jgi:hypothetical protein
VRLELKFRESAPPEERQKVIEQATKLGAESVEPLFPDESDGELASLYKVEGVPDEGSEELLSTLQGLDPVEFAEPTPKRKLIR